MTEIHIGSKNPTKIQAAENVFTASDLFKETIVTGMMLKSKSSVTQKQSQKP